MVFALLLNAVVFSSRTCRPLRSMYLMLLTLASRISLRGRQSNIFDQPPNKVAPPWAAGTAALHMHDWLSRADHTSSHAIPRPPPPTHSPLSDYGGYTLLLLRGPLMMMLSFLHLRCTLLQRVLMQHVHHDDVTTARLISSCKLHRALRHL